MEVLQQFPEEYATCFNPSFSLLNKCNVRYFAKDKTFLMKYWRFFYLVPIVLLHMTGSSIHIGILLSNGQMMDVAYLVPPFLVSIHATLKCLVIIPKSTEITAIIAELGQLWRTTFSESQSKEKNALLKTLNFCNKVSYWVTVGGSAQYLFFPLLETLVRRYILKQDCKLQLPIASIYPFDSTANWFIYIAVYAFQAYAMFTLVFVYTGSELIMITLCALLGVEFTMLKEDLSSEKPIKDDELYTDGDCNIRNFVIRHQKLIKLSWELDKVFNRLVFVDLLFVGLTTCAFSFAGEFARGPIYTITNYVAEASSMLTVLYLCFYGEVLTRASGHIGDAAYSSLWYKAHKQNKMAVILMIKISQKPCCLTSLKYATVSLNLFTKVVSTTWSYFSLLNSVYKDDSDESG